MSKVEPRTLPGFMELLPNDQIKFNSLLFRIGWKICSILQ